MTVVRHECVGWCVRSPPPHPATHRGRDSIGPIRPGESAANRPPCPAKETSLSRTSTPLPRTPLPAPGSRPCPVAASPPPPTPRCPPPPASPALGSVGAQPPPTTCTQIGGPRSHTVAEPGLRNVSHVTGARAEGPEATGGGEYGMVSASLGLCYPPLLLFAITGLFLKGIKKIVQEGPNSE